MSDANTLASPWWKALQKRPAASAAAVFIGGIVLHPLLAHRPGVWIADAVVLAVTAMLWIDRRLGGAIALALSVLLCGVAAGQIESFQFRSNDISGYSTDQPRLARIELLVDEPLRVIGTQFSNFRPVLPRQVTTAKVLRVMTDRGWTGASGRILVQIDPPNEQLRLGQTIRVLGMLQRPGPAMNPGQFDWAAYYREQRMLTSIHIPQSDAIEIVTSSRPSLLAKAREGVRSLLAAGFSDEQSLDHALLRALVLGDNDPELSDVQEQFRRTGTSHHLAISGMHIAVVGAVVFFICRLLRMTPRKAVATGFIVVILYGLVALPSPPVVRSVLLCVAFAAGVMGRRSTDGIQLLALSVLAMLIYHPLDLYNAGFQLSFGTVLGLMLFTPRWASVTKDEHAQIAIAAGAAGEGSVSRWLRVRHYLRRTLGLVLVTGMIAWLTSMPLIAFHFEQLNPWAIFATAILALPVLFSLLGGFVKIILTAAMPFGASWWASIAAAPVAMMRHTVDALAHVPGSDVPLPAHSISLMVVYYALLCAPLFMPIRWPKLRWTMRLGPAGALLLFIALPLTGGATRLGDGSLRVHVMAVGAGQCCLIELPDGRDILLDAGSTSLADPMRKCIGPYLRNCGLAGIDEIWLSHGDFDHINAAGEILRAYDVPTVRFSTEFEHHAVDNPPDAELLNTIDREQVQVTRHSRGDRIDLGKGASLEVLWPTRDAKFSSNESGLVLKLTYARRTILFPADIQQRGEAELLKNPNDLRCDVLLAPHHGSSERTTRDFIAAADPLYIVSSNDRTLSQKQRLFERQIGDRQLFRTNDCGAITIRIDKTGGLTVTPFVATAP
jgi:competence protein ComEC